MRRAAGHPAPRAALLRAALAASTALTAAALSAPPLWAQTAEKAPIETPLDTPSAPQELIATPHAAKAAAEAAKRRAADARRQAKALEAEEAEMAKALSTLGPKIVARETALFDATERLDALHAEVVAAKTRLEATQKKLRALLAGVQRAAREPTPSLVILPDRPVAAARSALLLRRLGVELQETAAAARADLDRISAAEAELRAVERKARADYAALRAAEADVRALLEQKRDAQARAQNTAAEASAAAKRYAEKAQSLTDLALALGDAPTLNPQMDAAAGSAQDTYAPPQDLALAPSPQEGAAPPRLAPPQGGAARINPAPQSHAPQEAPAASAAPPASPPQRPAAAPPPAVKFSEAKGGLLRPVASVGLGPPPGGAPGAAFATAPYARVIAPWSGEIVYADSFPHYGRVVIIEPQPDFLVILTGLAEVDRAVGERVLAGEPLGRMGGPPPTSSEFLYEISSATRDLREELYVEIRRKGAPIDPRPWFKPETRKASGL